MRIRRASLLQGVSTLSGMAAGILWYLEHRRRAIAERMAAATLESLLNAIDANDPETGAHVRRVASYALVIGRALDFADDECAELERAALFHDIGKIHEALFDLVHEPSTLSEAEYQLVTTHTERGAEVLAPLEAFYPALADGVRSHHERWDGTGYPAGLAGPEIPLIARVIAIADSFDAITHQRRYKRGQHAASAARKLAEGRGTQFDPQIVDLVLLPPVFDELVSAHREMHRRARDRGERRVEGVKPGRAPEVTFRWRPAAPRVRSRRASAG